MHVFYIYATETYSNKICKYKSLHEINFIYNECLDSVFIQQHMHTHLSSYRRRNAGASQLPFDP